VCVSFCAETYRRVHYYIIRSDFDHGRHLSSWSEYHKDVIFIGIVTDSSNSAHILHTEDLFLNADDLLSSGEANVVVPFH